MIYTIYFKRMGRGYPRGKLFDLDIEKIDAENFEAKVVKDAKSWRILIKANSTDPRLSDMQNSECEVWTKRGHVRTFSKLDTVAKFLLELGVESFKVFQPAAEQHNQTPL